MRLSFPLALSVLTLSVFLPGQLAAQTVQTNDYIYIGVEAEDHVSKNDRWVLTTPSTPTEENDPDGNHSDQASGSTYLELLPDIRVTHDDPFGPPVAYWGAGGQGPDADYSVTFPEPGRYYVHVRAYSTGTEDNGIHIGLNGNWPASGQRLQLCSAAKRSWWWSSAQRDSGGMGSCGIEKSIWLDIPTAGTHTVSISAREDGFEIDRLVLIKDKSDNTRVCSPLNIDDVNCRNGSIESADEFVDLRVRLTAEVPGADPDVEPPNPREIAQGENITVTAKIENLDNFDTANDIVLTLSPVEGDWNMISNDSRCSKNGTEFDCTLDELHPTAPDEHAPFVFTMQAIVEGDLRIDASVTSADMDDTPGNDVAATIVRVLEGTAPVDLSTDVKLSMDTDKNSYAADDAIQLTVYIANIGDQTANDVTFRIDVPQGLNVVTSELPGACTAGDELHCSFATIDAADTVSFKIELTSDDEGVFTFNGILSAENDDNASNNIDSDSLLVEAAEVVEPTTDTGSTTSADSGATTDTTAGSTEGSSDTATQGSTAGQTVAGVTTTAGSSTLGATTFGTSTQGSVDSGTDGSVDSAGTDGTTGATQTKSDSGAASYWFALLLLILVSARLYGWHQGQRIAIRK